LVLQFQVIELLIHGEIPLVTIYKYERGAPNEDTPPRATISLLLFRIVLQRLGVEVLRRGTGLFTLFSNLYLYESDRVDRDTCRGVGTVLLACTSTNAATFFWF